MYNEELQQQIREMFNELRNSVDVIIESSHSYEEASERITNKVAAQVSAESEGYIVDIYSAYVKKIKNEEFFENAENLNAFYKLNLREELHTKYHFDITSLEAYKKGIEFEEINSLYAAAGAVAGTLAVGGILKFALGGVINIPFILVIAGAVVAAIAAYKMIEKKNKNDFSVAVNKYLRELENEILEWLTDIEIYFDSRVRELYKRCND